MDGYGEIEVHLHHDNDTEDNFRSSITRFKTLLHEKHGALPVHPESGEIGFAFIHGNWCLDNSLPGGGWCGLDNELTRSEEHTSELQSLMRISYAVFCLKKKKKNTHNSSSTT